MDEAEALAPVVLLELTFIFPLPVTDRLLLDVCVASELAELLDGVSPDDVSFDLDLVA